MLYYDEDEETGEVLYYSYDPFLLEYGYQEEYEKFPEQWEKALPLPTPSPTTTGILFLAACALVLVFLLTISQGGATRVSHALSPSSSSVGSTSGSSEVEGSPTLSVTAINAILQQAGSPAAGTGDVLYSEGVKYGMDPVYPLAFFEHESGYATTGVARLTHSLSNMRCTDQYPCDQEGGGYAIFSSWQESYDAWYMLIKYGYIGEKYPDGTRPELVSNACPCRSLDTILPVYAPSGDHNDPTGYITAVRHTVAVWRAGSTNPYP